MGQDTKALRNRIKSVDSTMHLTKAMGLVASSKIRRANEAMMKSRAYAEGLSDLKDTLLACPECSRSPYLREGGDRLRMIVIAGDRGLAGGYNANIFRLLRDYPDAEVIPIGRRACDRAGAISVSSEHFTGAMAHDIAKAQCADFLAGKYDRLCVLTTKYVSIMAQEAYVRDVLPLKRTERHASGTAIFEPDEATILAAAIPEYVAGVITACVRESFACEVAARRMAMDSAGKNASVMIDDLRLKYNRARQGAITQEITEIVAGSGT